MLNIKFEVNCSEANYGGFELGHVILRGSNATVSSKDYLPSQAMMVFTSVVTLLDGVRRMLEDSSLKRLEWVGDDSSFTVLFERLAQKKGIRVMVQGRYVADVSERELGEAVFAAVSSFVQTEGALLVSESPVAEDLRNAWTEFRDFWAPQRQPVGRG